MTEADWLAGKSADDMLDAVADRVSARRWRLLGAALTRKLWDVLPPDPLRAAVEFAERTDPIAPADAADWRKRVAAATDPATAAARDAIRESVRDVETLADEDPDAPPTYPSEVLYRAAVGATRAATRNVAEAASFAAEAVGRLFADPSREEFEMLIESVKQADTFHSAARQGVANAHKLAAEGEAFADAFSPKTARVDMARAEAYVRRIEEGGGADDAGRQERAYNKLLARILHELVGNPFAEYRFDPAWRTGPVMELARTIRDDRAFDRLPALADALLDADCDAEAVLRHCRGTEKHATEKPQHLRGCWVIDLILAPDDPLFTAGPVPATKRKPRDWW